MRTINAGPSCEQAEFVASIAYTNSYSKASGTPSALTTSSSDFPSRFPDDSIARIKLSRSSSTAHAHREWSIARSHAQDNTTGTKRSIRRRFNCSFHSNQELCPVVRAPTVVRSSSLRRLATWRPRNGICPHHCCSCLSCRHRLVSPPGSCRGNRRTIDRKPPRAAPMQCCMASSSQEDAGLPSMARSHNQFASALFAPPPMWRFRNPQHIHAVHCSPASSATRVLQSPGLAEACACNPVGSVLVMGLESA